MEICFTFFSLILFFFSLLPCFTFVTPMLDLSIIEVPVINMFAKHTLHYVCKTCTYKVGDKGYDDQAQTADVGREADAHTSKLGRVQLSSKGVYYQK